MHSRIMTAAAVLLAFTLCGAAVAADDGTGRYARVHHLPTGQVAVVAEGDFEPRSIGSYSLRIYSNAQPEFPTDDFVCGVVRARDGGVEDVRFADLDQDGRVEIVVTMRSAGSGSYLSADAFSYNEGRLAHVAGAYGLAKDADCVAALAEGMKPAPGDAPAGLEKAPQER